MLRFFKNILTRPHPGYGTFKSYFLFATRVAIGVFLVLAVFQPFGINDNTSKIGNPILASFVYAMGSFVTALINFVWILIKPKFFANENWTLGKEIGALIYQLGTIAFSLWAIGILIGEFAPSINSYIVMFFNVFTVGIMPYLIVVLARHVYLMRTRLRNASVMNIGLMLDKEKNFEEKSQLVEMQPNINPVDINHFVSAEGKGEYIIVNVSKNGDMREIIVEKTLCEFEAQNTHIQNFFRCHDNFIVNKNKIIWVEGNAAGYKLNLHPKLSKVAVSNDRVDELAKIMDYI